MKMINVEELVDKITEMAPLMSEDAQQIVFFILRLAGEFQEQANNTEDKDTKIVSDITWRNYIWLLELLTMGTHLLNEEEKESLN